LASNGIKCGLIGLPKFMIRSLSQKVFSDNLKLTSGQITLRVFSILFLIFYARVLTPFELSVLPVFAVIAGMSTLLFNIHGDWIELILTQILKSQERRGLK